MSVDPPRLLQSFERLPGRIKVHLEDFQVEEVQLYPFAGEGTHTYFQIEKRGLNTLQAIHDIAAALNVHRRDIGYAGLKDARAVTRQWLSIEHVPPEAVQALQLPRLKVLQTTLHRNKLKLGHLRANRFVIRVRDTQTERLAEAQQALGELARLGVPNYFGPQRFGQRKDNHLLGAALLRGDFDTACDLMLGRPGPNDFGDIRHARELYDQGRYEAARNRWPGVYREQRRALKALAATGKKKRAILSLDRNILRFYVSAYQSALFNEVVARRMATGLNRLQVGDLAWRHANGAVFRVEDVEREQPRADALEISPTGPLFGPRMTEPSGEPAAMEKAVFEAAQLPPGAFHTGAFRAPGGRRAMRFAAAESSLQLGADRHGPYLELAFLLPRGCYATALLRELFVMPDPASDEATDEHADD
jgi:tRNA pseudouridine13 synthase